MKSKNSVAIVFEDITKRFGEVLANDHISFEIEKGTIHALLGENGAGKTTLMNILYGLYLPDGGRIYLYGKPVWIDSPKKAIDLGIGMVHQHFRLVENLSVIENIILGLPSSFFFPARRERKKIEEISAKYGLKINPLAKIWQLSTGEKQRVEILKALYRKAEILILDEPTSVLAPAETRELFKILRALAEDGKTIIFITHKLEEVFEVSDRVTVLRKGRVVKTIDTWKAEKKELAKMMIGRGALLDIKKTSQKRGEKILEVENLYVLNDLGIPAIKNLSFEIREGEIVGIAGVAGNGQKELAEALSGLRQVSKGRVKILGKDVTNASPRKLFQLGLAYIPENRQMGLVEPMRIRENFILKSYWQRPFSKLGWLNHSIITMRTQELVQEYGIKIPSMNAPASTLSGGNRQRLILAREFFSNPKIIIASHPTYGLDVGATKYIRNLLLKEKEKKTAILLISEDLDEIFALSDRIMVLFEGEIIAETEREKVDRKKIGLMMTGIRSEGEKNDI